MSIKRESDFLRFMEQAGPAAPNSKNNYISWLRFIDDDFRAIDETLTKEIVADICYELKLSKNKREKYRSDPDISNIKSALNKYLAFIGKAEVYSVISNDLISIIDADIKTSQISEIEARIGQGKFRKELIEIWGKCSLTEYSNVEFLVASHIKPWKDSNNHEKLDPYNGLLLTPNIDKLFDSGYITFKNNGEIVISNLLSEIDQSKMHISKGMKLFKVHPNNISYLEFHRNKRYVR